MELSEIEMKQIREDYVRFQKGLKSHIQALVDYVEVFAGEPKFELKPEFEHELKMAIDDALGFNGAAIKRVGWFEAKSISRLWNKINK